MTGPRLSARMTRRDKVRRICFALNLVCWEGHSSSLLRHVEWNGDLTSERCCGLIDLTEAELTG